MSVTYDNYRQARMRWLPLVPAHWNEQRAKTFFREVDERSRTGQEELLSVSHLTGVTPRSHKKVTMFKAASYVGAKLARPGDIVINTLWAWMAALGASRHLGIVSPAYGVYRPHDAESFNPGYLDYLLRTRAYVSEYIGRSTGIRSSRLRLYPAQFLDIPLLQPPQAEQDQIVTYLRAQDVHIARFIKVKRELIALLSEQRSSVIDAYVTQGLNPAIAGRSCEIDWLDSIPEHWSEVRLRQLAVSLQTGPFGSQLHASDYVDDGIPVINPSHLKDGTIVPDPRCTVDDETCSRLKRHRLEVGDIVFARRGELGRCAPVLQENAGWLCGTGSLRVRLRPESVNRGYLMHVLSNPRLRLHLRLRSVGSTMDNANTSTIGNIRVPLPPPEEQLEICTRITAECRPIDSAIQRALDEIELVREYRLRLIADVVTGQVDVRAWQPGPDDQITEEDLTALGDDNDNDNTEEETDGDDGHD